MKKVIIICVILLIVGVGIAKSDLGEEIPWIKNIQEWLAPWKEKAESAADDLTGQISEQLSGDLSGNNWGMEGAYDIDTAGWFEDGDNMLSGSQEYMQLSSGNVSQLLLRAAGCKVEVIESEEADFYFSFENMKKVQADQEGDRIVLNAMRDTELNGGNDSSVLKLYVPAESGLSSVELEIAAGSMNIDVLQVQTLRLSVEAGKLTVGSLRAETLSADLGAGMVALKEVAVQDAQLAVGAGSMTVAGDIFGNVEAECAMGSLQMELTGDVKEFNYALQCVAGNIQIGEEKYSGINEETRIDNEAAKIMELDCAMGSMIIGYEKTRQ